MFGGVNVKRRGCVPYAGPGLVIDNQSANLHLALNPDNSRDDNSTYNTLHISPYPTCGPDSIGTVTVAHGEDWISHSNQLPKRNILIIHYLVT